ncbi:MAG: hypothetical protein NTX33_00040 [Propionibacteriales bacterium]|nr:hypothetical protein [Propionibacteriales bacterium]
MVETLLAAAFGAIATAAVGSLIISSDRLRDAASVDASLLAILRQDHEGVADAVEKSMVRAAAVSAIRSTSPAITLSETACLAAVLIGMPAYAVLLVAYQDWLAVAMGTVVTVALMALYTATTAQWCQRAHFRVAEYGRATLDLDAREGSRQTMFVAAAQGVLTSFSLILTCMVFGNRLEASSTVESVLFVAALAVAGGTSWAAWQFAKVHEATRGSGNFPADPA